MMKIELKLYASLGQYLPEDSLRNVAQVEVGEGSNPGSVLADFKVPPENCHLVLVNGVYLSPSDRDKLELKDGDALAVWPPVAGG